MIKKFDLNTKMFDFLFEINQTCFIFAPVIINTLSKVKKLEHI